MKIHRLVLALFLAQEATAFMPVASPAQRTSSSALNVLNEAIKSDLPPFPMNEPFKRLQGGGTVMTWPMPVDAERVEMMFRSSGRPMKVTGECIIRWIGNKDTTRFSSRRTCESGGVGMKQFHCQ